jgi:hypothetical protein
MLEAGRSAVNPPDDTACSPHERHADEPAAMPAIAAVGGAVLLLVQNSTILHHSKSELVAGLSWHCDPFLADDRTTSVTGPSLARVELFVYGPCMDGARGARGI